MTTEKTTEKSPALSGISLQELCFPIAAPQKALPRFDEVVQAMASNLGIQAIRPAAWHIKMNEFAEQNTIAFWLVLQNGGCLGYIAVGYPEGPEKVIIRGDEVALGWFVLPEFRRKGVAAKAVGIILKHLKKIPVASIRVDIDDSNEPSVRLAHKFGFTVLGQGTGADGSEWKSLLLAI